ncbi:MAG: MoaD/ThiS family protein [Syntrophomonas sp.]|nr:MoaD/ThiS family protein [Syntrophomonas sp.]
MEITLRLFWTLSKYSADIQNGKRMHITVPDDARVRDLIEELKIPVQEVGLIVLNGSLGKIESILNDKDDVQFFPPIEGG